MTPPTLDEADQALRVALTLGDPEEIERASKVVDDLERTQRRAVPSLHASALWYAERGIPVFVLRPGRKQPLGSCPNCRGSKCNNPADCGHDQCHGVLDATTDPERINRWWEAMPTANIGLATGVLFDVVDIDGPVGQKSRAEHWDDIFAKVDADALAKVLTPRPGGMHIYVPPTGDPNGTDIVPKVDYRGAGGYVLAPPSVITPGGPDSPGPYRFLGTPSFGVEGAA